VKQKKQIIPLKDLVEGFTFAVDNASELLSSAMELQENHPAKALALAQIGQEEIGKSLTILASAVLPAELECWSWFWDGWKDHKLKAHRAYLYELISPMRIEFRAEDRLEYAGEPLRSPINREKEVGLYVDYDLNDGKFITPSNSVSNVESLKRISTLMYLWATADAVKRTLCCTDAEFRFAEFGCLAYRFCTEDIYQQQIPEIYRVFCSSSDRHSNLLEDLERAFKQNAELYKVGSK
jgi:AbiV family abortive infection protein